MSLSLTTRLEKVLRTTNEHIAALEGMGIKTVEDLLLYLPRAHEDLSEMLPLDRVPLGQKASIRGTISGIKLVYTCSRKKIVTAQFIDAIGNTAEAIWFNQPHIKRMLQEGDEVVLTGKVVAQGRKLQIQSPQFEQIGERPLVHAGRLVPVYPQHEIITTKWLREKISLVRSAIPKISETLPEEAIEEEGLLSRAEAIEALHFPEDPEDVQKAKERFAFEDMFRMQESALLRKKEWQGNAQERLKMPLDAELVKDFFASLKFTPTNSQKIAIYEILRDMEKDVPMSRLLEGDVGSGKTLVAVTVMAATLKAGGQCALMVPTEVLAKQHAQGIAKLLLNFHAFLEKQGKRTRIPSVSLLTGSTPAPDGRSIRSGVSSGTIDIVIGTHALIEDSVQFHDLRLVIVDEQHRFGVMQRKRLIDKGSPHFLSMTATPIPRTLALTAYGDHDLSVLLEKPGNRKSIVTKVVPPTDRQTVERFIDYEIEQGRQVFVVCPLITGSDAEEIKEVKSVEAEYARLNEAFSRRRIALLHGKLSSAEKQETMERFKQKDFDILVSTSVIEVGIDVPNATIMVIEGSERFGLAQLHQFRGRVGRGDHQSHCFLFTTTPSQARSPRLKAMETYDSGFQLAEVDLKIRGPGEIFGVRQSGVIDPSFSQILRPELIVRARRSAQKMLGMPVEKAV